MTIPEILSRKRDAKRIVVVTAYDYPTAVLAERAGVDIILVGDSGGMVALGYESTMPVTIEEMVHFGTAVCRGAKSPLIVVDMPFMSYQATIEDAIRNAGRIIKETGADSVKIEGGVEFRQTVKALVERGIPVMGHVALTPQTSVVKGGYRLQGRRAEEAKRIVDDAEAVCEAGAFAVVLEFLASEVAEIITRRISVPTIGIGSGPKCDGQVLVLHDILGLYDKFTPKFVKKYANLSDIITTALCRYREEVQQGTFPGPEHTFHMMEGESERLAAALGESERRIDQGAS